MEFNLKGLLMAFMVVVIGAALLTSAADTTTGATQTNTVTNEQVTLANGTGVSLANNQIAAVTSVVNATNATDILAVNTQYTINLDTGVITGVNEAGLFNVTYTWREVGNSTARTLISFNTLFFALGVFLIALGALAPVFKDMIDGLK